jgi:hypothetical protein
MKVKQFIRLAEGKKLYSYKRKKICRNCVHCFLEFNLKFACGKTDNIKIVKYNRPACEDYISEEVDKIYNKFN